MASEPSQDELSYRERDVDKTLDNHGKRISRLEKATLVAFGYALATGSKIVTTIGGFF